MSIAAPAVIVEPFGKNAVVPYITLPIPVVASGVPGAACFNDGFPALTMTANGVPPSGADMNGLLYMLSSYCAWLQAGGFFVYSASVATAGGYPIGAVLRSASDVTQWFFNTLADNTNNPDVTPTGWLAFSPLEASATGAQTATLGAGQTNDFALTAGGGVGFLDITANAAGSSLSGLANGKNGQLLVITNVSANVLTLKKLTGSASGNQLRLVDDLTLLQYGNQSFRKSTALNVWVPV